MTKDFKYDVVLLIEGVKGRPCLWDKSLENYKDRVERRTAWEEIFATLEERYYDMAPEERRLMEEKIITKWTNVRDTFLKSLKTKMGRPKKKYLLHDNLKFLTKNTPHEEPMAFSTDDIPIEYLKDDNVKDVSLSRKRSKRERDSEESVPPKRNHQIVDNESQNNIDFVHCEDSSTEPRFMNEDEAFFASLLPTVVTYTLEERLDFRMEVLSIMKKINDKKKNNSPDF